MQYFYQITAAHNILIRLGNACEELLSEQVDWVFEVLLREVYVVMHGNRIDALTKKSSYKLICL